MWVGGMVRSIPPTTPPPRIAQFTAIYYVSRKRNGERSDMPDSLGELRPPEPPCPFSRRTRLRPGYSPELQLSSASVLVLHHPTLAEAWVWHLPPARPVYRGYLWLPR